MSLTSLPNEVLHRILKLLYPPGSLGPHYTPRYPLCQRHLSNEYWDLVEMAFVSPQYRSLVLDVYEHFSKIIPKESWEGIEHAAFGSLLGLASEEFE